MIIINYEILLYHQSFSFDIPDQDYNHIYELRFLNRQLIARIESSILIFLQIFSSSDSQNIKNVQYRLK